jgi:hypothetical protein
MGLPARLSSCPQGQDDSGVAAEERSGLYQRRSWPSGSPDLNLLDYKLWAVVEDMACRKRHNNLDSLKRSLVKAAAEVPSRRCVRRQQSGRSVWRLGSGQRAAILSDIIINKNLKLLLINYLARKVDVLFHFPSKSQNPCNRTYGKTMHINDWSNESSPPF